MERIKVAFLGGSHSHGIEKAKVVAEHPGLELAGIVEEKPAARAPYEKAGMRILGREQALRDASIRVIAVESDNKDHSRDARLVLEAGKHLHLEKPPAATLREFQDLVALAAQKRLLMQMGYMWRYNPAITAAMEAARNGWLGEVYLARGTMNTLVGPEARADWAQFRGGQMFEQGCHIIDIMVRLLGRPAGVSTWLRKNGPDELADNTAAVLEFPKALGVVTSATIQPNAWPHRFFEVLGTNGSAVVRPIEPPALAIDLAKAAGPYRAGINRPEMRPYRRFVDDFAELEQAVRQGKPLSIPPEQDLLVQETVMRASLM